MAIGQSRLHEMFRRGRRISDIAAWYGTFESGQVRKEILDWIKEDQLQKGVDGNNEVIGLYSYATELISNGAKQEGDPYTLYDTGEFYRSMYLVILPDTLVFEADPMKGKDNLFTKLDSGSSIIKLNTENRIKLTKLVKQRYIEYIKEILLRP